LLKTLDEFESDHAGIDFSLKPVEVDEKEFERVDVTSFKEVTIYCGARLPGKLIVTEPKR